jgi:uncharacterized membrane protein
MDYLRICRGDMMKNKETIKKANTFFLLLAIVTFALSAFYNTAFIPSFMLMLALFLFGLAYYNMEDKKKYVKPEMVVEEVQYSSPLLDASCGDGPCPGEIGIE